MAANEKSANEESETDLQSPNFDPVAALYSENVIVPTPDAREFGTVYDYERFVVKKRNEKSNKAEKETSSASASCSATTSIAATAPADDNKIEPIETATSSNDQPSNENTTKKGTRHTSTIFSRIDSLHQVGPLSLLKKCMTQNLVVKVMVRSAHGVRGYCRGYIAAFDNHFNIAMRDVDEVYTNPLWTSRSARRRFHKQRLKAEELRETSPTLPSDTQEDEPLPRVTTTETPVNITTTSQIPDFPARRDPCDKGDNDDELSGDNGSDGGKVKVTFTPQHKTLCRHVNQMLIKGDNVVVVIVGGVT